jgi:nitrous oxidase accessory protein NosD
MARRDLSESEIRELKRIVADMGAGNYTAVNMPRAAVRASDLIERLAGEVLALRERESWSRQLHEIEGEF